MNLLHVINGTAVLPAFRESGLDGEFVEFSDVLHEGAVPPDDDLDAWLRRRAAFIAECGWATTQEALEHFRSAQEKLDSFRDYDDVVLWYEHDLFDQLLLIRHLAWWWRRAPMDPPLLVLPGDYLGPMSAAQLLEVFAARTRVTEAQLTLASSAWRAFTAPDPGELTRLVLHEDLAALPDLDAALRRLIEEYPSAHNGLGRTEQQLLEIVAQSPLQPYDLFAANARREERVFMGDAVFFLRLRALLNSRRPLLQQTDNGPVKLTDHGASVLAGEADAIELNGIDRWIGGVHLTTKSLWRREGAQLLR